MNKPNRMNIDQLLQEIAQQEAPRQVDVAERVMAEVAQHPYMQRKRNSYATRRIVSIAMAATLALVVVNVIHLKAHSYDEDLISSTISQVNNYESYYSSSAIEELAPLDYIYDDEYAYAF